METPRTIKVGGFGEIIVDIGLGSDAAETLEAVEVSIQLEVLWIVLLFLPSGEVEIMGH